MSLLRWRLRLRGRDEGNAEGMVTLYCQMFGETYKGQLATITTAPTNLEVIVPSHDEFLLREVELKRAGVPCAAFRIDFDGGGEWSSATAVALDKLRRAGHVKRWRKSRPSSIKARGMPTGWSRRCARWWRRTTGADGGGCSRSLHSPSSF